MLPPRTLGYVLVICAIVLGGILFSLKSNADTQGLALCQAYTEQNKDMASCPAHDDNVSWSFITAFGITFIALGTGVYFVVAPVPPSPPNEAVALSPAPTFDASSLEGDEKGVWEKMVEANGSLFQSDLTRTTGFSKVKLSRILDKLESKGAIERKRRGMANLVVAK
ncbi:MAG: hypothetical protein Q8P05_04215 [Candidatus Diapherotrites archaeon]|nr:hypothetical protein [Candidatus Diapherotrites archaeon]MDZ4256620.1 hypothetical protein [archaeon]